MKKLVTFVLCLPFLACVAGSSESTGASSSNLTTTSPDQPVCVQISTIDPNGHVTVPISKDVISFCPTPTTELPIAPGDTMQAVNLTAGVGWWINPAAVNFSISGLPAGVTAQFVETSGYVPPIHGVTGAVEFSVSPFAPLSVPGSKGNKPDGATPVLVTVTSGTQQAFAEIDVLITGICAPLDPQVACSGRCNAQPNGCSGSYQCGSCPSGTHCTSTNQCVSSSPQKHCPSGTMDCGDGTCVKHCT